MNSDKENLPTLQLLAAVEVFNIIYNIYYIVKGKRHLLCFCHMQEEEEEEKCSVCVISAFSPFWFKSQARRDFKYLINFYNNFVNLKKKILEKSGHKVIFLITIMSILFFAFTTNNFPPLCLMDIVDPHEILFY